MSPRLLLVGGPGGSGSSTWAAALADDWAARGLSVGVVSLDPRFGAHTLTTHRDAVMVRPEVDLPEILSSAARSWGLDPFVVDQALALLSATGGPALWQLPRLLERFDRVVVDAGAQLSGLVLQAHRLPWLLSEAGPLHSGWLRATRPVIALAMGSSAIDKAGASRLAAVAEDAVRLSELVMSRATASVLCARNASPTAKVRHHACALALAQCRLGAVVTAGDDVVLCDGPRVIPMWSDLPRNWDEKLADPPRESSVRGDARDGAVTWELPLPFVDPAEVELEQSGNRLTVAVQESRRTFVLPSLLARHVATGATVRQGILGVTFEPTQPEETS